VSYLQWLHLCHYNDSNWADDFRFQSSDSCDEPPVGSCHHGSSYLPFFDSNFEIQWFLHRGFPNCFQVSLDHVIALDGRTNLSMSYIFIDIRANCKEPSPDLFLQSTVSFNSRKRNTKKK
jgi:hypothetical protein